jgi:hypothetical protein
MNLKINGPSPFKFKDPKTGEKFTLGSQGKRHPIDDDPTDFFDKFKKSRAAKVIVGIAVAAVTAKVVIYFINEGAELVKAAKKLEKAYNS